MKVTVNWLREYTDFQFSVQELADALTMVGLEVEAIYPVERSFSAVVIGRIRSVQPHPNAGHLSLCLVDTGDSTCPVVCGAPNAVVGLRAPLARPGAILRDGERVTAREIRGEQSDGMLCSEAELGLSERADGLMVLPDDAPIGTELTDYLGEPDTVFDISVTPNRPDCLSVIGICREISTLSGTRLRRPDVKIKSRKIDVSEYMRVKITDPERCPRYSGRLIENICIKPSPFWLAERLHAVDIRSINNVVDITNYVMMETGQPLHAFDYHMLEGGTIVVRTAMPGERFTTLDENEHVLDEDSLLICDKVKPVALAGIMGGLNSEVTAETGTVFLESAHFSSLNIRRTAKRLDILTESSRRFERGVDPEGTVPAMNRAAELMVALAEGQVYGDEIDEYVKKIHPVEVDLSVENTNILLGTSLEADEIRGILEKIGLGSIQSNSTQLRFRVPTSRPDLEREVDLIEEVASHYGFSRIPTVLAPRVDQTQEFNQRVIFRDQVRTLLAGLGFWEAVSLNLVPPRQAQFFLEHDREMIRLLNPMSPDLSVFRPHLLISLLSAVAYNRNRQLQDLRLFELGDVAWRKAGTEEIVETTHVAGLLAGKLRQKTWYGSPEPVDFFLSLIHI